MEIVELPPDDGRLDEFWDVMGELRSHLDFDGFRERFAEAYPHGYRMTGLWDEGECRAAGGYRISASLANGRYLYVDDLVTAERFRGSGYGKLLLDHLVSVAEAAGCDCVTLDSGVHRHAAHRFYLREGFFISSHHFWRGLHAGASASSIREQRP